METLTIKINTRTSKGKHLFGLINEMVKDGSVEIEPNAETKRAILDVKEGKVTRCNSAADMMNKLNA
ncbi:MAG: hypothetical protein NTY07_12920 [Bacteroidia bacterium]|nr:hypothetical protein [Bacteroidia bacterium]